MSDPHELLNFPHELLNGVHELLARASVRLWPAFANHLWQATLFAALVLGVTLLLRSAPARVRFALWLLAAAKFAVPSALFAPFAAWLGVGTSLFSVGAKATGAGAPLVLKFAEPVGADSANLAIAVSSGSGAAGHAELLCALTLVWLAGCAALACVWLRRRHEFVRSVRAGEEVWSGRAYEALRRARARLRLKEDALLVLSDGVTEPGVWRTRRPVVVLPRSVAAQLDDEELESVLMHELAHVERRDNLFGNLQTALACALWFNPVVWLVGRRLLAERERACDERVLEAGGAAAVYAAGILKVVRFCSGWRVAGVSGAASGSDLRRRIEMIMREERAGGSYLWHRAVTCGLAAAALALTAGAGLLGRAPAAEARMLEGVGGETQDGSRVVVVRGGRRGVIVRQGEEPGPAVREVEEARESIVRFDYTAGAPAAVTEARMRLITREQLRRADEEGADSYDEEDESPLFVTLPTVTVANTSASAIREVGVGFETNGALNCIAGHAASLKPGESQTFRSDWRGQNIIIPGTFADVSVRVVWVTFEDGTQWGARTRDPNPPMPPPPPRVAVPTAPDAPTLVGSGRASDAPRASSDGVGSGDGEGAGTASGGTAGKGRRRGGQKLNVPQPSYPPEAKAAGAEGEVSVKVMVDEDGNVVAAEAVSGHPLLRTAAVDAAREAKFKPTFIDGKPVKVSGVLSYVFKLKKNSTP